MYFGEFKNRADVCSNFNIDAFDGVIVFAAYDVPDYEGYADVIYINEGKFYHVSASHCSCYGLENQWTPEEMPLEALVHLADNGFGTIRDHGAKLKEVLEVIGANVGANPDVIEVMAKLAFG